MVHERTETEDWDPSDFFPKVTFQIVKPKWMEAKNKVWHTRASGLYGPTMFRQLLKTLITDWQLEHTTANGSNDKPASTTPKRIHFVDQAMQHAGRQLNAEFGKALSRQQEYLKHHITHTLQNISEADMVPLQKVMATYKGFVN